MKSSRKKTTIVSKPLDVETRLETINILVGAWTAGAHECDTPEEFCSISAGTLFAIRAVAENGASGHEALMFADSILQAAQNETEAEEHRASGAMVN